MDATPEFDAEPSLEHRPSAESPRRRLERSRSDRLLAGVAGGLGEYLGIDAGLVRIAFVILCLFGGVGLVIYGSGWLLMPETDGQFKTTTMLQGAPRHRVVALVGAFVFGIAALVFTSNGPFWRLGRWRGNQQVIGWLALLALAYVVVRGASKGEPPHWRFNLRRIFARGALVIAGTVFALGAAVFVVVLVSGVSLRGGIGSKQWRPISAAQLQPTYRDGIGNMTVDLRNVLFPDRTIHLSASVAIGHLMVKVPPNVAVSLTARSSIGDVIYGPGGSAAFDPRAGASTGRDSAPLLVLDVQTGIGQVQLERALPDLGA